MDTRELIERLRAIMVAYPRYTAETASIAATTIASQAAEIERLREALDKAQHGTPFSMPPEPVSYPSEKWVEQYAAWYDGCTLYPEPNKEGE